MNVRTAWLRIVASAGCAAALCGCAFVDRGARLVEPPPDDASAAEPAADAGVVSLTVADARPGAPRVVGHVKNGFGMNTADVAISEDPVPWVRSALERELRAAGVRVVSASGEVARLDARIQRLECDAYLTYEGHVDLTTTLTVAGRPPAPGMSAGEGGAGLNWSATEDSYSQTLALALRDAARKVARAVAAALKPPSP